MFGLKFRELNKKWQIALTIIGILFVATAANLIIDGGAAAHDLLCFQHGSLWK